MPLPLRVVEPVHVSRGVLPDRFRVRSELEASANGTLANVIRQLSTLSHNAGEIFADLIQVGTDIATRASNLQARIDRLAVKVVQMDGLQDESTSMQDSLNTKPFQSSMMFDQQVVSRQSLPPGMSKIFQMCNKPPPLDKLNKYRDDGKDGLKFYTDPNYFFDLWRQDMLKDTERAIYDRVKKPHKPKHEQGGRHKKRVRQPTSTRERQRHVAIEQGEYIIGGINHHSAVRESPDGMYSPEMIQRQHIRPNSIEFKYQNDQTYGNEVNNEYRNHQQMHQSHYEAYNNQQSHLNNNQRYYPHGVNSPPPPYESPTPYVRQTSIPRSTGSLNQSQNTANGFAFRPSQPPPAPPPAYAGTPPSSHSGTPTRSMRALNSRDRETLPPPPPPPVEHLQQNGYQMSSQMNGHVQEPSHYQHHVQYHHQHYDRGNMTLLPPPVDDHDEPLPPPPPTPDQTLSALHMAIANLRPTSEDHLPPSPPPPPLDETDYQHPQIEPPPPPPPPPPPMANGNGNIVHTTVSHSVTKSNEPIKRHVPVAMAGHTELLKAIRDGIALRKVDKKEPGKEEKAGSAYHDVASILARRVAVEMSDSDSGSDSEYDSDVWGDETSA